MKKSNTFLILIGVMFVVVRLVTLGLLPLTDPSEARFANAGWYILRNNEWFVSRIFSQQNEWLVYMAKPPFFPMLLAGSFSIFGINEFAARLPSFLSILGNCFIIWFFCAQCFPALRLRAPLIYLSLPSVFLFSIAAITDPVLSFFISAATVFLFLGANDEPRSQRYIVFGYLGMAGAVLIKGPIGAIFPLATIGILALIERDFRIVRRLFNLSGIALFIGIVTPLYLAIEYNQPGFFEYFLIHENFGRYLFKDFGIRYGSTHRHFYGAIWLFFAGLALPWLLVIFGFFSRTFRGKFADDFSGQRAFRFLIVWTCTPLIFFTFARQILPTYIFPCLAPAMIFVAHQLEKWSDKKFTGILLLISVPLFLMATFASDYIDASSSTKALSGRIMSGEVSCDSVVSYIKIPQSLNFYLRDGEVSLSVAHSKVDIENSPSTCIVVSSKKIDELLGDPSEQKAAIVPAGKTILIQRKLLNGANSLSIRP